MPSLDRTFSHRDVIRIYEKHLDAIEIELVDNYFSGAPGAGVFTTAEIAALKETKRETLGDVGTITVASQVIGIVSAQLEFLRTDFFRLEIKNIDGALEFVDLLISSDIIPGFIKFILNPQLNLVRFVIQWNRDVFSGLQLIFGALDSLKETATELERFRATVGIWAIKV